MCDVCRRYINELIEALLIAKAKKERQGSEKADELAHQRIPDPMPQKIPSSSGLEMTVLGPLESRQGASDFDPLQKNKEIISKTIDYVRASAQSPLSQDTKSVKEVTCTLSSYTGVSVKSC